MLKPPAKLRAPSPQVARLLGLAWFLLLSLTVYGQIQTTWQVYVQSQAPQSAYASLGIQITKEQGGWLVQPRSNAARDARVPAGPGNQAYLIAINGHPVDGSESVESIEALAAGSDGQQARLGLKGVDGDVRLTRSADNRASVYYETGRTWAIVRGYIDSAIAVFILLAAFVLRWRKFDDPIAILISFALLLMVGTGTSTLLQWLEVRPVFGLYVPDLLWLALVLIACPAFPSGRYAPGWTRWIIVAVPAGAAAFAALAALLPWSPLAFGRLMQMMIVILLLAALLSVILRFRFTPRGAERQRMKWVTLGLAVGLLLYPLTRYVELEFANYLIPDAIEAAVWTMAYTLNRFSAVIMTLGFVAPLLDYRLNDADSAIGRSIGYATVTALVAVVWAGSAAAADTLIRNATASSYPGIAAAISTFIAFAIFTPTKTRALAWTEGRFQRALVRLKSLPERIGRWQHGDDPEAVAASALKAIAKGVDASGAALIARPGDAQPEIIGVHEMSPEAALALLGDSAPGRRKGPVRALRIEMTDYAGRPLLLLLGPRSDGASYSRQERSAVSAIAEPLADAIYAVSRRAALNERLTDGLAGINARLDTGTGKAPRRTRAAGLSPGR